MKDQLQTAVMFIVDCIMAVIPRSVPPQAALRNCKVISHRGENDNVSVFENTLPAFEKARASGVWGIECDIRWTQDLVPVICHDASGLRVFGVAGDIADMTFSQVRELMPLLPTLAEVVAEFGGNTHLMLEIKEEPRPDLKRQRQVLQQQLAALTPGGDYHFLALAPELFELVDFLPRKYWIPVAELNITRLSEAAISMELGGLTGHYLLLGDSLKQRHELHGQRIGTGFPNSRNSLFRELHREVEWIFSNDAVKLQAVLDAHLRD